jgi:hypothetical protein
MQLQAKIGMPSSSAPAERVEISEKGRLHGQARYPYHDGYASRNVGDRSLRVREGYDSKKL